MNNLKTKIIILATIALLGASCNVFQPASGGILKTANGGIDWQVTGKFKEADTPINTLSISKLSFNPQGDTIFAGTYNAGLYKSNDGGRIWEEVLGKIPVIDFAINPSDTNTIYAVGTLENRARALVTHDNGKSWTEIFSAAETNTAARAVALNPNNPAEILIGLSNGAIIKSIDGGTSWQLVQNYNDRINQIIWRDQSVYVVVRSTGIFKSIDGGFSFAQTTSGINSAGNTQGLSIFGSNVSSYNQLAISNSNPNILYATTNLGLYRSINAGNSWQFVRMPLKQSENAPQAVAIAPSTELAVYVSARSNIYKTSDGGQSWVSSDTGTNNLINALLVSPDLPQVAFAGVYLSQ